MQPVWQKPKMQTQQAKLYNRSKKVLKCKNGMDLLYQYDNYGEVWSPKAEAQGWKVRVFSPVPLLKVCPNNFAIMAFQYRKDLTSILVKGLYLCTKFNCATKWHRGNTLILVKSHLEEYTIDLLFHAKFGPEDYSSRLRSSKFGQICG